MLKKTFRNLFILFLSLHLLSCGTKKDPADLIVHNGIVYTVDSSFSTTQAFAIKDGKILESGTNEEIFGKYYSKELLDAKGKAIFPGFIDSHCHFLGYGLGLNEVDLVGTNSFDEVIERVKAYAETNPGKKWIIGRGWDQNDWEMKEFPTKEKLDSLFPDRPVFLKRIDGHAALANDFALKLANINAKTKVEGGELLYSGFGGLTTSKISPRTEWIPENKNPLSGVLIDNAVTLVEKIIPLPTKSEIRTALLSAQKNCFEVGLTTVDDAGLMKKEIHFIDSLQKTDELKMRIYAMIADSAPNYDYYLKAGPYKTDRLNVRSFKFYADGALGSRGACLKENYSDKKGWRGFFLKDKNYFRKQFQEIGGVPNRSVPGFQINVHAIGDSAIEFMLHTIFYGKFRMMPDEKKQLKCNGFNKRNRIEHFQILPANLGELMCDIIPSVQPTHATSDYSWAINRLGKERMKYAYAYKTLLKNAGVIALGTDFPVEDISPFKTFYAAVFRKTADGLPAGGFQMEEALTREETIKGMTIWGAFANFEEKEKGSIEKGKFADFIILDTDLMKADEKDILKTKVIYTYLNGEKVFQNK